MADKAAKKAARKAKLKMRFKGPKLQAEIAKTVEKLELLRQIEQEADA